MFADSAASRMGWIGRLVIGLLVLSIVVPLLANFYDAWRQPGPRQHFHEIAIALGDVVACFSMLMIAARGATLITSEKERDCWVSLLSTPLSAGEIVAAKLLGNLYAARWTALLLGLIGLLATLIDGAFVIVFAWSMATWLLLACYASCLGLAFSLRMSSSTRAMAAALAIGIFFGGVYLVFAVPIQMALSSHRAREPAESLAICIPYLLAFPGMVLAEHRGAAASGGLRVAYLGGMLIYATVSGLLWSWCVATFDERAGRMREQ